MFASVGTEPPRILRPSSSSIREPDWEILSHFWYPVALSTDVRDRPESARLLDVHLVLFRDDDGAPAIVLDTCPHRHVRLSTGTVIKGEIVCPFHGLRFNRSGQCVHVPALGRRTKLPASYRVTAFPAVERYGLVWTCLGDPERRSLPHFPSLADADPRHLGYTKPVLWPVSAPRQVENFADLAHLPLVHRATLGGDPDAPILPGKIEQTDDGIVCRARYVETGPDGSAMPCQLTYRIVLPFAVDFTTQAEEVPDHCMWSCDIPSPVSAYESMVFQILRTEGDAEARQRILAGLTRVNEEDIAVLETLQLPDLPLDQHHEIHLPVDNIAGAYRARLRKLGLGAPDFGSDRSQPPRPLIQG